MALAALSCVKEEDKAIVDLSKATPPVLLSGSVDGEVTVKYTPGVFDMDFNQKMNVYHTLALVSVNEEVANITLSTRNEDNTLTLSAKTLTNALKVRGFKTDDRVPVAVVVRASIQDPSRGITNGYVDSENRYAFTWVMPEEIAGSPYEDYTQASTWSLIGSLTAYGINWDGDIAMVSDGSNHAAFGVVINADDEFKFRQDKDWAVNLGGDFGSLDAEFAVSQDGPNVKVPAGVYDIFVNPGAGTATVAAASGLKVSSKIGAETPGPEPQPVTGWNIIGLNGNWDSDVLATNEGNVWTAFITAEGDTEFKWRKDGAWDENYGGVMVALGEPFEAVAGGDNIKVSAGFYKVVLDLDALTITVTPGDVYALIGTINGTSWDTDFLLTEADGVYTSETVNITGGFKIRHNYSWADEDTYGADGEVTVGTPFTAVQPGSDISVPAGNYKVRFVPATKEVTITQVDFELPDIDLSQYTELPEMAGADTWGIIGPAQAGGWNDDYDLQKISEDPEIWGAMNVAFKGDDFKFRGNDTWGDYDLGGGTFALNEPIVLSAKGSNITAFAGTFNVFLYPTYGVAYIQGEGTAPEVEYPEFIYCTGGDTGWAAGSYALHGKNGVYKGFGYLSQEFKFKPNDGDNWSGDWEYVGEGQIGQGSDNFPAPEASYYMIDVDLNAMTYALTPITTIGVIGPAQPGGWNDDTDMTYNVEGGYWEISGIQLAADEMKFRANDGWDINWGGSFDALTQGGANIAVEAGTYDIKLYAWCDGKAYAQMSGEGGEPAGAGITIDGDMSDWANVQGAVGEGGTNAAFKVASDEKNIYFYVKRTMNRFNDLWGGAAYHYYTFDLDGDASTGTELWGNGPYEMLLVIYPYAGSADAPAFGIAKAGAAAPAEASVANAVINGVVTDSGVETEVAIPRADLLAIPSTPVTVTYWSNKDGSEKLSVTGTL